jgi:type IV secretion system protein VirB5
MQKQSPSWRAPEPAQTPYHKAQQEWDRRMGAATVQAANWRLIAFGLAGLLFFSTAGNIYLGAQPKAVPHFVEIDKLGQPNYLGPLDSRALRAFTPTTASLHFHLTRFVADTREISSDAAVLKRNWLDAYKLVTPDGANELNAYVKEHNPFDQLEKQVRVSVEVSAIVAISKDTWQVDWAETAWDEHGNQSGTTAWRGTFHILLRPADTAEKLEVNPLGLFIDEFHWTRLSTIADGRTTP